MQYEHHGWAGLILIGLLAGCEDGHRQFEMTQSYTSLTTPASERLITNLNPQASSTPGIVDPANIVCVEPPPSVATVAAVSSGGGLSLFGYGSVSVDAAVANQLLQLEERTVGIQAIVKAAYQNCLDYSNGAINRVFYALRVKSLDDLLVTLTTADMATGNYGRSLGALGTTANGEATTSATFIPTVLTQVGDAALEVGRAEEQVSAVRLEVNNQKTALAAAEVAAATARSAATAGAGGSDASALNDTAAKREAEVADLRKKLADAEKALGASSASLNGLTRLLQSTSQSATEAQAGAAAIVAAGGFTGRPSDATAAMVGEMQRRFLDRGTSSQHITACMVELSMYRTTDAQPTLLAEFCRRSLSSYIDDSVEAEQRLTLERVANERFQIAALLLREGARAHEGCEAKNGTSPAETARLRDMCRREIKDLISGIPALPAPSALSPIRPIGTTP